jgi:signal transduction histidine kinase
MLSLIVAGLGLGELFQQHLSAQLQKELNSQLDQLTASVEIEPELSLNGTLSDPRFSRPLSGLYWQIQSEDKTLRSRSLWDQELTLPAPSNHLVTLHTNLGTSLLVLLREITINDKKLTLAVAIDDSALHSPLERFKLELWQALTILGIGLMLAVLLQLWLGLQPLKRLREELSLVIKGKKQKLPNDFPSELSPLVQEFNAALKQNQLLLERARTQAGNLAHALKTPLTILANAAHTRPIEPIKLASLVNTEVARARAQVDYHLSRAKAAATRTRASRCTVLPTLEGLVRVLHKVHSDKDLCIQIQCAPELQFQGEEADLQEMLGNLMDNACKWAKSQIQINAQILDNQLHLAIEDDGLGIEQEQKSEVLKRGTRLDERSAGSGLGLNIVNDLAQEYGGELRLEDSTFGGLKAVLNLPLAA